MDRIKLMRGWVLTVLALMLALVLVLVGCQGTGNGADDANKVDSTGGIGSVGDTGSAGNTDRASNTGSAGDTDSAKNTGSAGDTGSIPAPVNKLQVICTLFPQYDFARYIAGDYADVTLLLSPGMEAHMYDPTPADMKKISRSDLFIYTGDAMEGWAAQIVESLDDTVHVLDLSGKVTLRAEEDHSENEVAYEHDDHGEDEDEHSGHHHHGGFDPHYWLDMTNAAAMAQAIGDTLAQLDPDHAEQYSKRTEAYVAQLMALDEAFFQVVQNGQRHDVVFGGRFAYSYFMARYGLDYATVYHSCSAESDPSVSDMIRVIDYIDENQTPYILYEELSKGTVAQTIAGDAHIQTAVFTTGHNVSLEEFDQGVTFIDLMEQNLKTLETVLND